MDRIATTRSWLAGAAWLLVLGGLGGCELIIGFDQPRETGAQCDDGLDNDGNGVIDCAEPSCLTTSECGSSSCRDGVVAGGEECDDSNTSPGDGCSPSCTVEPGFTCTGMPSVCTDRDECQDGGNDCAPGACVNTPGGFSCACPAGTRGDGHECLPLVFVPRRAVPVSGPLGCDTNLSTTGRKVAVDEGGTMHAVMRCGATATATVVSSHDLGGNWSAPASLGANGLAELAVEAGPPNVAYWAGVTQTGDLVFGHTLDGGLSWSPPQTIGNGFEPAAGVSLAHHGHAVFVAARLGGTVIVASEPEFGAGTFTKVDSGLPDPSFDVLVEEELTDQVLVVGSDAGNLRLARSSDGGASFGALEPSSATTQKDPDFSIGRGTVVAVSWDNSIISTFAAAAPTSASSIGEFPSTEDPRERSVSSSPLGAVYMVTSDTLSNEIRLQASRHPGDTFLDFGRSLPPGRSPSIAALPTDDGVLLAFTSGTQVLVGVELAPKPSCLSVLETGVSHGDGVYVIDPDGDFGKGNLDPFPVLCEMSTGGWTMVYKLSRDLPVDPLALWTGGQVGDGDLHLLDRLADPLPYVNDIPGRFWNQGGLELLEARVSVYTAGAEQASIGFQTLSSDNFSWFAHGNITGSSFAGLSSDTFDVFSIGGDSVAGRTWYVSHASGTCTGDEGYLVVDTAPSTCPWEIAHEPTVSILFANQGALTNWNTAATVSEADAFVVWVK